MIASCQNFTKINNSAYLIYLKKLTTAVNKQLLAILRQIT